MEDGEDGEDEEEDVNVEGKDVEDDHIDWGEEDMGKGGVDEVAYCSMG